MYTQKHFVVGVSNHTTLAECLCFGHDESTKILYLLNSHVYQTTVVVIWRNFSGINLTHIDLKRSFDKT